MKSQQVYSALREHLAPLFMANGFKRTRTMLSWARAQGDKYIVVWCQVDRRGWDVYAGSKFVLEFQLSHEPVVGISSVRRQRLGEMLSTNEREEIRTIQNKVIASLHRPPRSYGLLNVSEELSTLYLRQFQPIDKPYSDREDIWLPYANRHDLDMWSKFLVAKLPEFFRQIETWG